MRKLMLLSAFAAIVFAHPAHAISSGPDKHCTGKAYTSKADYMFRKQSNYYLTAYQSGAMTMKAMATRLALYTKRYTGLEEQFETFMQARAGAGADFSKPAAYIRALADFLASVEVDTHMADMCQTAIDEQKQEPAV